MDEIFLGEFDDHDLDSGTDPGYLSNLNSDSLWTDRNESSPEFSPLNDTELCSDEFMSWILLGAENLGADPQASVLPLETTAPAPPKEAPVPVDSLHSYSNPFQLPPPHPQNLNLGAFCFAGQQRSAFTSEPLQKPTLKEAGLKAGLTQTDLHQHPDKHEEGVAESKRRKRSVPSDLEIRLSQLREENEQLKRHLENKEQKAQQINMQKLEMEEQMKTMVKDGAKFDSADLRAMLKKYKDLYADYGDQRKKEIDFHVSQLETLLLPTQTTKMSLWTLEQDESFYAEDTDDSSLMHILSQELGVTPDQKNRIKAHRTRILEIVDHLKNAINLMHQLRDMVEAKHLKFEREMAVLQSLLTPKQAVSLMLWVSDNKAKLQDLPGFKL